MIKCMRIINEKCSSSLSLAINLTIDIKYINYSAHLE